MLSLLLLPRKNYFDEPILIAWALLDTFFFYYVFWTASTDENYCLYDPPKFKVYYRIWYSIILLQSTSEQLEKKRKNFHNFSIPSISSTCAGSIIWLRTAIGFYSIIISMYRYAAPWIDQLISLLIVILFLKIVCRILARHNVALYKNFFSFLEIVFFIFLRRSCNGSFPE